MAQLEISPGRFAEVTKEGNKIVFTWSCGAKYGLTKAAYERTLEHIETVKKIKGAHIPVPGLKVYLRRMGIEGEWQDIDADADAGPFLQVNGSSLTVVQDWERVGGFTLAELKRAVKKALKE